MNKDLFKTTTAWFAALSLLPLAACSDMGETGPDPGQGEDGMVTTKFTGIPYLNSPEDESEKLSEVNVFHFKGEDFMLRTDVDDPYAESIGLPANGTTRIYCVSGVELSADEGVKEVDFAKYVIDSPEGATTAPLFFSGTADFTEESLHGGQVEISMKRGVARIDFANTIDPDIIINKVIVEDAPACTFVFPCDSMPDCGTVTFTREFTEPFQGMEAGMFQIFESTRPVKVRVLGEYRDTPINILTSIPTVARNKVYTLQITNINSNVSGAFTVKDWQEGSLAGAIPSTGKDLFIDQLNSVVPEGVEVNYGKNLVTVPFDGAKDMKLAFLAKTKVSVSSVEGEVATARISVNEPVKIEDGYISSFNVTIEPNKRLAYSVIVNIKDEEGRQNFVEIKVEYNPVRTIETVEIAGSTWMAFNCTSPDIDKQIYPVDGLGVEETYQENWLGAVGYLYQFGRQYGYVPYRSYNPCNNLGGQNQDMPWVNYSHMPCPEGYHVATLEEFRTLCPSGTVIPGTYTAGNGESITVTIHSIECDIITPTNVGGVARYMKFTSNDTGNFLILPIAGYKSDKSTAANPAFGKDAVYWTNSNKQCYGGHARAYRFLFNWGDTCKMEEFQFAMEAFAYVRAIKNKE